MSGGERLEVVADRGGGGGDLARTRRAVAVVVVLAGGRARGRGAQLAAVVVAVAGVLAVAIVPSSAAVALVVVVAEHVGRVAHVAQEHDEGRVTLPELEPRDQVLALARLVSPAVHVEPDRLRAVRLAFLPRSAAALEADLWWSPLVQARNADGLVL
jgi:hypothetical protein